MAINLNKVTLIGRLGSDPDVKNGQYGDIVRISVATTSSWKSHDGEKQEKTEWHKVVIFAEPTAKFVRQYVKKGDLVYVEGALETRKWDKDNGETAYITEIVIRAYGGQIQAISKDSAGGSRSSASDDNDRGRDDDDRTRTRRPASESPSFSRSLDDDIPF